VYSWNSVRSDQALTAGFDKVGIPDFALMVGFGRADIPGLVLTED